MAYHLDFVLGRTRNALLKDKTAHADKSVMRHFVHLRTKHQHFFTPIYTAKSWQKAQICYTNVESTGKGLNVGHIVSTMSEKDVLKVYLDFYVQRGEASENRSKEIKNRCFSDQLSCHRFWSNVARLFIHSLAYVMFLPIKQAIGITNLEEAQKLWVDTIRTRFLKIGATLKKTVRRVYYQLSKALVYRELFGPLIYQ